MTIIKVKKYLFIGVKEDVDTFFTRAQEKGFVEFLYRNLKLIIMLLNI